MGKDGRHPGMRGGAATGVANFGDLSATETETLVLRRLGFAKPVIARMAEQAAQNGTTIEQELLSDGGVEESAYYAALAGLLELPYLDTIDARLVADLPALDTQLVRPTTIRLQHPRRAPVTVIVPEALRVVAIRDRIEKLPDLRQSLAVTCPSNLKQAVWKAGAARRVRDTINALFDWQPRFSARIVFWGRQGFYTGLTVATLTALMLLATELTLLGLHIFMSNLYLASLILRMLALAHAKPPASAIAPLAGKRDLPVYTVMVALYREAAVAEQLMATLNRLDWPASRLDIKLICEADDEETIAAIRAQRPGPQFEIVEVPKMEPRTKPKALSYALPAARGDYLAIYDAEDRPHPGQLREAYARFQRVPCEVVSLQAPLVITNARESWISALFSLEYSALFRALLPMLARNGMPMPLGGTSNHFKTDILRSAGGWDPFNVTEDADLGMRLYRLGYRSDVISRPTLEDAPTSMSVWTGQRTRWLKGWLQTWLVTMRDPSRLRREMGTSAFLVFNLLIGGVLVSSLLHPFILIFLAATFIALLQRPAETITFLDAMLFTIDTINIFGSYAVFLALGKSAMIAHEKKQVGWRWVAVPVYWMMISWAAGRAVFELRSNPFFWKKTPHQPSRHGRVE